MIAEAIPSHDLGSTADAAIEQNSLQQALDRFDELGGTEFVAEMVELLHSQTAIQVEQLEVAHAAGDWSTAQRMAHTMKSTFGNFGARSLQSLAYSMEIDAKNCDAANYPQNIITLKQSLNRLLATIDAIMLGRMA